MQSPSPRAAPVTMMPWFESENRSTAERTEISVVREGCEAVYEYVPGPRYRLCMRNGPGATLLSIGATRGSMTIEPWLRVEALAEVATGDMVQEIDYVVEVQVRNCENRRSESKVRCRVLEPRSVFVLIYD